MIFQLVDFFRDKDTFVYKVNPQVPPISALTVSRIHKFILSDSGEKILASLRMVTTASLARGVTLKFKETIYRILSIQGPVAAGGARAYMLEEVQTAEGDTGGNL